MKTATKMRKDSKMMINSKMKKTTTEEDLKNLDDLTNRKNKLWLSWAKLKL